MKAIDVELQMALEGAKVAYPPGVAELARTLFHREEPFFRSEEEYIAELRQADVKGMPYAPGDVKEVHDYAGHLTESYPDVILGWWGSPDIQSGVKGVRELERCIKDLGMIGIYTGALITGIAANDKMYWPFYEVLAEAGLPVKLSVGMTAAGQGTRGGGGVHLVYENPIPYVDDVAVAFPNLNVIAAHCAWPFHNEMIAVLVHKANVFNELHGWYPRYFPPEMKREINGRLQDKFMFGSDWPWLSHQRLFQEWESGDYKPEVLEKLYYKNAQRVFGDKIRLVE